MSEDEIRESAASLVDYGTLAASMRKCLHLAQTLDAEKLASDECMEYGDILVAHLDYLQDSREAFEDKLWYNAVDAIASEHSLWLESGEGDPTDLFLCMIGD